jgi:hypothetical protein
LERFEPPADARRLLPLAELLLLRRPSLLLLRRPSLLLLRRSLDRARFVLLLPPLPPLPLLSRWVVLLVLLTVVFVDPARELCFTV